MPFPLAFLNPEMLDLSFYQQHVVDVARQLLGKTLVCGPHQGIITETEAYRGSDDPASHAYRGLTPRNAPMFGPPGHAYVYLIYGIHHCLNIVAEQEGQPAAVLIRSLKLPDQHLQGPGRVCRHLNLTRAYSGSSLVDGSHFYLTHGPSPIEIQVTPRIGIRSAKDYPWRFLGAFKAELIDNEV